MQKSSHFSQAPQQNDGNIGNPDEQTGNLTCRIYRFKLKRNLDLNTYLKENKQVGKKEELTDRLQ